MKHRWLGKEEVKLSKMGLFKRSKKVIPPPLPPSRPNVQIIQQEEEPVQRVQETSSRIICKITEGSLLDNGVIKYTILATGSIGEIGSEFDFEEWE